MLSIQTELSKYTKFKVLLYLFSK